MSKEIEQKPTIKYKSIDRKKYSEHLKRLIEQEDPKTSFERAKFLVDRGDDSALTSLGVCYQCGIGVKRDLTKAIELYESALKKGQSKAGVALGTLYFIGLEDVRKDLKKARRFFQKAAKLGSSEAQNFLEGRPPDPLSLEVRRATDPYLAMAKRGELNSRELRAFARPWRAATRAGRVDAKEGAEFQQQAAAQGDPEAQCALAESYLSGEGVSQDRNKAIELYKLSAKGGNQEARHMLALLLRPNPQKPVKSLDLFDLALRHEIGQGMPKDMKKAIELCEQSAAQGNIEARYHLAWCYEKGKGVPKDLNKATDLYQSILDQGDGRAKYDLARCRKSLTPRKTPSKSSESDPPIAPPSRKPLNPNEVLTEFEGLKLQAKAQANKLCSELSKLASVESELGELSEQLKSLDKPRLELKLKSLDEQRSDIRSKRDRLESVWKSLSEAVQAVEKTARDAREGKVEEKSLIVTKAKLISVISPEKDRNNPIVLLENSQALRAQAQSLMQHTKEEVKEKPKIVAEVKRGPRSLRSNQKMGDFRTCAGGLSAESQRPTPKLDLPPKDIKQHPTQSIESKDEKQAVAEKQTPLNQIIANAQRLIDLFSSSIVHEMDQRIVGYALETAIFCLTDLVQTHLGDALSPDDLKCVNSVRNRISHDRPLVYDPNTPIQQKYEALLWIAQKLATLDPRRPIKSPLFSYNSDFSSRSWLASMISSSEPIPHHNEGLRPQVEEELNALDFILPGIVEQLQLPTAIQTSCAVLKLAQHFILAINPVQLQPLKAELTKKRTELIRLSGEAKFSSSFFGEGSEIRDERRTLQKQIKSLGKQQWLAKEYSNQLRHEGTLDFFEEILSDVDAAFPDPSGASL